MGTMNNFVISLLLFKDYQNVKFEVPSKRQELNNNRSNSKKSPYYYFVEPHFFETHKLWIFGTTVGHLIMFYSYYVMVTETPLFTMMWSSVLHTFVGTGMSVGVHMLWSHRSYEAKWPVRVALMLAHTMSGQFTLYTWAAEHRAHHKWSDSDGDPNNPRRGSFYAHIGWVTHRRHPEAVARERTLDCSDIMRDPVVKFQSDHVISLYIVFGALIPIAVPMLFWGETLMNSFLIAFVARSITMLHNIMFINSAAHLFGDKTYNAQIGAADNFLVSAMIYGAGYHNYHHSFPQDYQSSEKGIGFNISRDVIRALAYFGLAYNLKTTTPAIVEAAKEKARNAKTKVHGFHEELPDGEYEVKYKSAYA